MGLRVYGIKNCNTVKKALTWLKENNLPYTFHDYKKEPATLQQLKAWEKKVPWESLVNKKGTTWRKLSPAEQAEVIRSEERRVGKESRTAWKTYQQKPEP